MPNASNEAITDFLHDEIFVNYRPPRELLSDNGTNFLSRIVTLYLKRLGTRHRTTTPYHPRTNSKVENLNGTLGKMLTKYLIGKPTRLWDRFLAQALFATRVRLHAVSKRSPFYLVYGINPRLPSDENPMRPLDIDVDTASLQARIDKVTTVRQTVNEKLLQEAVARGIIRDQKVVPHTLKEGQWVLLRNESRQKFEPQWFGPYKVLKRHTLGTYALQTPDRRILKNLIHGNRLRDANTSLNNIKKY